MSSSSTKADVGGPSADHSQVITPSVVLRCSKGESSAAFTTTDELTVVASQSIALLHRIVVVVSPVPDELHRKQAIQEPIVAESSKVLGARRDVETGPFRAAESTAFGAPGLCTIFVTSAYRSPAASQAAQQRLDRAVLPSSS